jgi:hypothetical protein
MVLPIIPLLVLSLVKDLQVSAEQGVVAKDASADFGDMFNWDVKNAHVQLLDQKNMHAAADERSPLTPDRE